MQIERPGKITNIGLVLASGAFVVCLFSQPALAEGFPGRGERVDYAEALPHYNLGNRYLAREWYEKAIEKYNDAINIYPYDADVYINLGIACRKLKDLEGAEAAYRKAIELNPDDWMSLSNLANLLMVQERFPESYQLFKRVLKSSRLPADERTAIEANIEGMRKILKARGLTLDGKPLDNGGAAPATARSAGAMRTGPGAGRKRTGIGAAAKSAGSRRTAQRPAVEAESQPAPSRRASDLDSDAYDKWLAN